MENPKGSAQHTPGPWRVHTYAVRVGPHNAGIDIGNSAVAVATVIGEFEADAPGPTAEANAAFIVRACNAHAELLAALDGLLSFAAGVSEILGAGEHARVKGKLGTICYAGNVLAERIIAARAAIAKAEGRS